MPAQTSSLPLTLDIQRDGTLATVQCHGKLVSGVTDFLYSTVSKLIPGSERIVLDLTDLTVMDSMGLGVLVRLYVSTRAAGCTFELINIGRRVRDLLEITHVWDIFSNVGEHGIRF